MSGLDLSEQFRVVHRFASDRHFGVREIAWMAVCDALIAQLDDGLNLLKPWVMNSDENLRRFASELTRPRGVWCAHIDTLKVEPCRALPLLLTLRADSSRYVQNSVVNWLNDASKSATQWVTETGERWLDESPVPSTQYVVRRGLRTLSK